MRAEIRELLAKRKNRDRLGLLLREADPLPPLGLHRNLPELPSEELQALTLLRRALCDEVESAETVNDRDILHIALQELLSALRSSDREDTVLRFLFWLSERKRNRLLPK